MSRPQQTGQPQPERSERPGRNTPIGDLLYSMSRTYSDICAMVQRGVKGESLALRARILQADMSELQKLIQAQAEALK